MGSTEACAFYHASMGISIGNKGIACDRWLRFQDELPYLQVAMFSASIYIVVCKIEGMDIHVALFSGVLDVDPSIPSTITAFPPGYIDKSLEKIVGLQTDAPLKRAIKPQGGVGMVKAGLEAYGFTPDPKVNHPCTTGIPAVLLCFQHFCKYERLDKLADWPNSY